MTTATMFPATVLPLRSYQRDALDAIHSARERGVRRQLLSLPTGAGKTYVASHLISEVGKRTVFMVHRDELARQARDEIRKVNPSLSIGICKADQDELYADVVIASAQTIARESRLTRLRSAVGSDCLFISDEAHHDLAVTRQRAIDGMAPELLVGLTATPQRGDGLGLDAVYQEIVYHLPMRTLVEQNHLARPVGLRIETESDLDGVHTVAGEFNEGELARTVDTDPRNRLIVESWRKHASDRQRTVVFCVTVAHAERVRDAFRLEGITAEMVDGTTSISERQRIFAAFRDGSVQVLTNCMVLTEGFDEPRIDCAIMARPTKSTGLYIQCVGRALRWWPGKPDALIVDMVDATTRHRLVTLPTLSGTEPGKAGEHPLSESDRKPGQVMDLFDAISHHGKLREREAIMLDLLAEQPFVWQSLPGGQWMAPTGSGWVTLVPEGDGFIPLKVWMRGGNDRNETDGYLPLMERPVDPATAMSVAGERIRNSQLTRQDARWRSARASEKQIEAAGRWRITVPRGATRGEVSDLIDVAAFRAAMRRLGLDRRGHAV